MTGPSNPNFKHGEYSQEVLRRKALLLRLANSQGRDDPSAASTLDKVVEVLRQCVDEGNFTAAKYVFDQLAGQPRTTTIYEISDTDLLERVAAVTAEYLGPDLYSEWWGKVKESLADL